MILSNFDQLDILSSKYLMTSSCWTTAAANDIVSFFNSGSSAANSTDSSWFGQCFSSCHKNGGPWNQRLLELPHSAFKPLEASSAGFSLLGM